MLAAAKYGSMGPDRTPHTSKAMFVSIVHALSYSDSSAARNSAKEKPWTPDSPFSGAKGSPTGHPIQPRGEGPKTTPPPGERDDRYDSKPWPDTTPDVPAIASPPPPSPYCYASGSGAHSAASWRSGTGQL